MNRIAQLEEFLKESPNDPFLYYALTLEYQKLGDDFKTRAGFEHLVQTFPDYVGTYYHFGKFLERLGESQQAEEIYRRGIDIAAQLRNHHAKGELMGALNQLLGLDDEDEDF